MKLLLHYLLFLVFFSASTGQAESQWLDRSHKIFFPSGVQDSVSVSQEFPVFWWNFVIFDRLDQAQAVCRDLKALSPRLLIRVECNQGFSEIEHWVRDWAQDLPLRIDRPSDAKIMQEMDKRLAQASLPLGDRAAIELLREDPLESWKQLKRLAENKLNITLTRKNGFFFDKNSSRVLIPIQAAYSPAETAKTRELMENLSAYKNHVSLIGPQGSTLRNENQVMQDLRSVSLAGYIVLAFFGLALIGLRRWRLLLLFPPVFVAVAFSAWITVLIFGSIHGLTLSLGAGIIGLTLDYGLNSAMAPFSEQGRTWRSNWIGMATTLVGLLVLMMSSIPLLRQMMVFSSLGMVIGFGLFGFLIKNFQGAFLQRSAEIPFRPKALKTALILALVVMSGAGAVFLRPDLDMKQFDFQDPHSQEVANWLYRTLEMRSPLFTLHSDQDALVLSQGDQAWADQNQIGIESVATYLPSVSQQAAHLATWKVSHACPTLGLNSTPTLNSVLPSNPRGWTAAQFTFFDPFISTDLCNDFKPRVTQDQSALRTYTWSLHSDRRWITLWLPKTDQQEGLVRKRFSNARSLRDVILVFPKVLSSELKWMAPLSVLLVLLILALYYRRLSYSLVALVPFLSGLGLFTALALGFGLPVSFITVIGLVMCFGFSFDYAVFAVDHFAFCDSPLGVKRSGVWEAITTAALATWAGFFPLLFCRHPVLQHLGQSLCISTVGCYLGAVWGVPAMMSRLNKGVSP